jgi:hypothetical protein
MAITPWRFGYCRKLTEGGERLSRTLAELLRGRAKFSFARGDAQGKWFWLGSESQWFYSTAETVTKRVHSYTYSRAGLDR